MIKNIYNIFIYLSLICLCAVLYRADYLTIPQINSVPLLFVSLLFLFAGFIGHAYSWKKLLEQANYSIRITDSIASVGLSVFGKYIPGKIWMILGRSAYISTKSNHDIKKLTILSLDAQIITLWTGLMIGFIGLLAFDGFQVWGFLIVSLWIGLSLILFSRFLHTMILKIYQFIFHKELIAFQLSKKQILSLVPWNGGYWLLWAIGFYFLIISLSSSTISILSGLGFPLAGTLGILAIITPGGIGIREGILTGFLTLAGLSLNQATSIAIVSRLWFLIGEFFIFLTAWSLHRMGSIK